MTLRDRLRGAVDAHEGFHDSEDVNVLMMSYDREGSWHATDTGPDGNPLNTDQVIQILAELIAELSEARIVFKN